MAPYSLGDHKYLPFVTNPYEKKQGNPSTNTESGIDFHPETAEK